MYLYFVSLRTEVEMKYSANALLIFKPERIQDTHKTIIFKLKEIQDARKTIIRIIY